MVNEALLVALVMFIGIISDSGIGDPMIKRPLVMATLTGLVLGDLHAGIVMGASLEVIFLGMTQIGGAVPSESMSGSVFGTAFAIMSGSGVEVALSLAVPIALLAGVLLNSIHILQAIAMRPADKFIAEGNQKGMIMVHFICMVFKPAVFFVLGFFGIMLGSNAVNEFVHNIPDVVMNGLTVTGQMLPALGLAILLNQLWDKRIAAFTFLGFVLIAYLKLPLVAIAAIGTVIAVFTAFNSIEGNKKQAVATTAATPEDIEEDFFND